MKEEALLRGRPVGFVAQNIHEEVDEQAELEVPHGIPEVPQGIIMQEDQDALLSNVAKEPAEQDWTGLNQKMKWWCPWNVRGRKCPGLSACNRMRVCWYFHRPGLTGDRLWLKHKEVSLQLCFISTHTH